MNLACMPSLRRIPLKKSSAPQPLRHPSLESTSAISKHLPLTLPITEHWLMNYQIRQLESLSPVSRDRKSTRLNSSHVSISYAVFCLKKKKNKKKTQIQTIILLNDRNI